MKWVDSCHSDREFHAFNTSWLLLVLYIWQSRMWIDVHGSSRFILGDRCRFTNTIGRRQISAFIASKTAPGTGSGQHSSGVKLQIIRLISGRLMDGHTSVLIGVSISMFFGSIKDHSGDWEAGNASVPAWHHPYYRADLWYQFEIVQ